MNVGYAQLQMKQDLGFSDLIYGTGASVFFLAYFLFEVPSNMLLERIGARKTITRIMFIWGLVSAATMLVSTPAQFYFVRFLLGVFEAGFFPGVLLYLTYWYPQQQRGRITGYFISSIIVAGILAGPVSGFIMAGMNGMSGLKGWQWMFLLEGLPATLLGIIAWLYLDDRPANASWLNDRERALLTRKIEADRAIKTGVEHSGIGKVFGDSRVWVMAFIYFAYLCASYTHAFWLPIMINDLGVADVKRIGLLSAIPSLAGLVMMNWYGRHSDLKAERRWHFTLAVFIAGITLTLSTLTPGSLLISMVLFIVAAAFLSGSVPVFWAVPPAYLSERGAAVGIALVTCVGQLGGVVAGAFMGWVRSTTGSGALGLYAMTALLILAGLLMIVCVPVRLLRERGAVKLGTGLSH
jgi:MFS family permease